MQKLHVLTRAAAALAAVEALLGSNPVQQQQKPASTTTTSAGTPKWVTTSSVEVRAPALQQRPLSSGIYLLIALVALLNFFSKQSHLCQIWLLSPLLRNVKLVICVISLLKFLQIPPVFNSSNSSRLQIFLNASQMIPMQIVLIMNMR